MIVLILVMIWFITLFVCFCGGWFINERLMRHKFKKVEPTKKEKAINDDTLNKAKKELENFYRYDGSEQG